MGEDVYDSGIPAMFAKLKAAEDRVDMARVLFEEFFEIYGESKDPVRERFAEFADYAQEFLAVLDAAPAAPGRARGEG